MSSRKRRDSGLDPGVFVAPEAPDGGYGWVVVVIAFLIHVIVDGAAFGYGVISNHIKEYYDATESQATLVGSLQLGFYLLSCKYRGDDSDGDGEDYHDDDDDDDDDDDGDVLFRVMMMTTTTVRW